MRGSIQRLSLRGHVPHSSPRRARGLLPRAAAALCLCAGLLAGAAAAEGTTELPRMVHKDGRHALLVDGQPFLILGDQVNNSSNWPAMLPKVWPAVEQMHANTVEIPVAWEQVEAEEGKFDFSYLDTLLSQAREHQVRLVLLWFATWKNNGPSYAPEWVKLDNRRFPRVVNAKGEVRGSLSPMFAQTLEADRKAFVALMRHLRQVDPQRTVIMVQVENESGTYGAVRDHSPTAEQAFQGPVPDALLKALNKKGGTWRQVFGKNADEFFHAWHVAHYIDQVAAAGKAEYPIPLYVNAALRDPFKYQDPFTYSSGGPTWNVLDIWKAAAPSIDVIGPDIYMYDTASIRRTLEQYSRPDNALFVPETANKPDSARYFFDIVGRRAIGYTPFGMDFTGYANHPLGAAKVDAATIEPFALNYQIVGPMAGEIARLGFEGRLWGAGEPDHEHAQTLDLGAWKVRLSYGFPQFNGGDQAPGNIPPSGGAFIAQLGPDEYLVTGVHVRVNFSPADGRKNWMMARVEEGYYDKGEWKFVRLWNGDQTDWGLNFTSLPQVLRVKLASY